MMTSDLIGKYNSADANQAVRTKKLGGTATRKGYAADWALSVGVYGTGSSPEAGANASPELFENYFRPFT
jgi:hypothetical protein